MSPLMQAAMTAHYASRAASEVLENLTPAQRAGVDELPPGAEFLLAEADYRWEQFAKLTGIGGGREPKREVEPLAADWRDTTVVDWAKGRAA